MPSGRPQENPLSGLRSLVSFWRDVTRLFYHFKNKREEAGWRPKEISLSWMTSLLVLEMAIVGTIISLLVVSIRRSGFVGLNDTPRLILGNPNFGLAIWPGFIYHFLPTFLMGCYSKMRETTLTAVWERQPYVELAKCGKQSTLQKTLKLDYSKVDLWKRPYAALRNGHYVIAICVVVGSIYSLALTPLTSYLFTAVQFDTNNTLVALLKSDFNLATFSQNDQRTALDTVNSIQIHGGNQPAWTFDEYAFPSFSVSATSGNVTAETYGYSANLRCLVLPQDQYSTQADNSSLDVSVNDQGCNYSVSVPLPTSEGVTISTSANTCSLDSGTSRLLVVSWNTTSADAQTPSNLSVISCEPTYWKTPGNLTVSFDLPSEPVVVSFAPENNNDSPLDFYGRMPYEEGLQLIRTFDPQTDIHANDFGLLVYNLAEQQDPQSPLDAEQLSNCTVFIYASVFAVFSRSAFFQSLSPPINVSVIATESVTRLIVVPPIAYTIIGIIAVALLLTVQLFVYTNQPSGLFEEPVGLIGAAANLHKSDIMDIIGQVKTDVKQRGGKFDGKIIGALEKYDLQHVFCSRAEVTPNDFRIVVEPKILKLKTTEPNKTIPTSSDHRFLDNSRTTVKPKEVGLEALQPSHTVSASVTSEWTLLGPCALREQ